MVKVEIIKLKGMKNKYLLLGTKNNCDLFNTREQALTVKKIRESQLNKKKPFERG